MSREYRSINEVEIHYLEGAKYPPTPGKYDGDIGLDIYAAIERPILLAPGVGAFISGGFRVQFGRGWAGLVLPRSSMNRKGLLVMTGVIDNGYNGEIGAEVRNPHPHEGILIQPGDRIAQLVIIAAFRPVPLEVNVFRETERGTNGFGSSGQ